MSGDDNFYSRMAAEAAFSDSEISSADPVEMSKQLANLDDLDAGLFSGKKDSKTSQSAVMVEKKPAVVTAAKPAQKKDSDIDDFDGADLDDMIDGILDDDDDDFGGKKKAGAPKLTGKTVDLSAPSSQPSAAVAPELSKTAPAVIAPAPVARKVKETVTFSSDEDDLLPDTAPPASVAAAPKEPSAPPSRPRKGSAGLLEDSGEESRPARSVLDSLLSKPKAVAELEQPKEKKEFSLDKYKGAGGKGASDQLDGDDDFWSGSYRPSTATGPKTKRRSVHFEDEDEAGFGGGEKRPMTAPTSRKAGRGGAGWLGLGDDDSDDLDFSVKKPVSKPKVDLSQTAPAGGFKIAAAEPKFVSRFEAEAEAVPSASKADANWEAPVVKKQQPQQQQPQPQPQPAFAAKAELPKSPEVTRKDALDFDFGLDVPDSKPSRQRQTSGSPEGRRTSPRRTSTGGGRRMAELFKAERQEEKQSSPMPMGMPPIQPVTSQLAYGAPSDSRILMELENKIKRLELEKDHLNSLMEMLKSRHEDEVKMIEASHKSKMEILEETYRRREQRLKEENALLNEQCLERVRLGEAERQELRTELSRRLEEAEREKAREVARVREVQRAQLEDARREHAAALESLKNAQLREQEAVREVQPTAQSIQSVIDQLASSTRNLSSYHKEVDAEARANQQEREAALRAKDEQLRALGDRLRLQEEETARERQRLQELVAKMDAQLREQNRIAEEEKWSAKQEQVRLEAQQKSLDEERRALMENSQRERESVERAKAAVLAEQKSLLAQLFEERKILAEERAQFSATQSAWLEKQRKNSTRSLQTEADIEGQTKSLLEERRRLDVLELELREAKEEARRHKMAAERERQAVEAERARVEAAEAELRRREAAAEERWAEADQARRRGEAALLDAKRVRDEQEQRLSNIQSQLGQMRQKEKQLTQDRLVLAKQREDLERTRGSILCASCERPVRDSGLQTAGAAFGAALPVADAGAVRAMRRSQEVAEALELDLQRRQLQIEAERDEDFLREERQFLEQLQRASSGVA